MGSWLFFLTNVARSIWLKAKNCWMGQCESGRKLLSDKYVKEGVASACNQQVDSLYQPSMVLILDIHSSYTTHTTLCRLANKKQRSVSLPIMPCATLAYNDPLSFTTREPS